MSRGLINSNFLTPSSPVDDSSLICTLKLCLKAWRPRGLAKSSVKPSSASRHVYSHLR